VDDEPVGGYIALSGKQLRSCRLADSIAALAKFGPLAAKAIKDRLPDLRGLFASVSEADYYLSKIGVVPSAQGHGYGRLLMRRYIEHGRAKGFARFRLDVSEDNIAARKLYEAFGFRTIYRGEIASMGISYLSQVYSAA